MPKLAANTSMMYQEHGFLDRFDAAAKDGFKAVEFLFPYDVPAADIKRRLDANGLALALFNGPPGSWAGGERGIASIPGREVEFKQSIAKALEYASVLGNKRLHVMAGLIQPGQDRARHREVYVKSLAHATKEAASLGITVVIEPINTRDIPGFFLNRQDEAHAICAEVGAANLKVQFDLYHCQIVEGDLAMKIKQYVPTGRLGHFQIAGVPERHEPDLGELHHPYLFSLLDSLGWDGFVGCEYRPRDTRPGGTSAGLAWLRAWRAAHPA